MESSCCCCVTSVVSDSVRPHRQQPTRLPRPWDSPGKNTGVGCHFLLQCSSLGPGFTQVVLESFTLVDRAAHWNGTTDGCTLRAEPAGPVDIHAWGHSLHEYSWTGRRQPSGCQGGCIRVGGQQSLPWWGSPLAAQPAASAHLWDESSWWCWFSWSTLVWF